MSRIPLSPSDKPRKPRSIRVLDLFAGAGGLSAGFRNASARYETVRAVELDPAAAASYEANLGEGLVYQGAIQSWLEEELVPEVDLVVGGPPCQGFSTLGKQDVEDERNDLWRHYAETVRRANPRYFIVENVAAFAKSSQFADFIYETGPKGVLSNYSFKYEVLNAAEFGSPQSRKRTVILGWRRDQVEPSFPVPTHGAKANVSLVTVRQTFRDHGVASNPLLTDLPKPGPLVRQRSSIQGPFALRDLHLTRNYSQLSLDRFECIPVGGNRFDIREDLLPPCWRKHTSGSGDVMGRLHLDRPAVTIRTEFFKPEKGRYLHPTENRAITHLEAGLLQGFPSSYMFFGSKTSIARQIGNAVPLQLGRALAMEMLRHL